MREETLDPQDWEAFRALAHRMVDEMLDVQRTVRERPVWRPVPDAVDARFEEARPVEGQGAEATYEDFLELVLPYPTGTDHPRFWGWAGGTGSPTGMMAEMLAAGMNSVSGLFNDGAARVEEQVVNWMKDALGFPEDASGVLTSGGSVANLIALAVGRDARAGFDVSQRGVGAEQGKLVFYVSAETHSSMFKSAKLLGLGKDAAYFSGLAAELQGKRDVLRDGLAGVGFEVLDAEGTYFVSADFRPLGFDGDDVAFCRHITTEAGVTAVPLSAFYGGGGEVRHFARFAFCKRDDVLNQAVDRLARHFGRA